MISLIGISIAALGALALVRNGKVYCWFALGATAWILVTVACHEYDSLTLVMAGIGAVLSGLVMRFATSALRSIYATVTGLVCVSQIFTTHIIQHAGVIARCLCLAACVPLALLIIGSEMASRRNRRQSALV